MTAFKAACEQVRQSNGEVLGISVDHAPAQKAWADQLGGLPYSLLGDWFQEVVQKYDVHDAERRLARRVTYIVDGEGVIRFVNPTFDARNTEHYDEVLKALSGLT